MSSSEGLRDTNLYESDFYTWTQRQAAMIRDARLHDADLANIAEEIESLGRSQVVELRSRYTVLCLHLLKKRTAGARWSKLDNDDRRAAA